MKNMNYPPHQVEKVRLKKWVENVENVLFSLNIYTETQGREASWFLMNSCINKKQEYVTWLKSEEAVQKLSQSQKTHKPNKKSKKKKSKSNNPFYLSSQASQEKKETTCEETMKRVIQRCKIICTSFNNISQEKEANTKAEKVQKK